MYRISRVTIGTFLFFGLFFLLIFVWALVDALQEGVWETLKVIAGMIVFPLPIIAYPIYLLRKRKEGHGFYWDEEGIVIDLKGNKVYWDEIESIRFSQLFFFFWTKSTVIYPHYTYHENIRARRNKWMPTPAHSVDWILIEKPKDYHANVMAAWEEKRKVQM